MRPETRAAFNRYLDRQAELAEVPADDVRDGRKFTVTPSIQQKLNDKMQEDSSFLQAINVVPVDELKGEKLGLGVSGPLASRTNTATTDRTTSDPSTLDNLLYECVQTNSDTHLTYGKLDMWAKFPDFQTRIRNQIVKRQALDRIMIGFNGVTATPATNTNAGTYPLRQDVNIGWLQHIRAYNGGSNVMTEGGEEDDKIIIAGSGGDYTNVNALVVDAVYNTLPSWAAGDGELVAILGRDLKHDIFFPLVNDNLEPSEILAADLLLSAKRVGGLKAASVPYFPDNAILITRLDNLSIYEQTGKRRRTIVDNAKRDRVETYESSNDGYVVEDFDYACLIENIQFGPTA